MVSVMLGLTAGLLSSYVTKHSSFLHVQQEMVVLPCSNYISYTSTFCIHNMSEASKISYKSMLAKTSKLLGFFGSLSIGFVFGSVENRFLWKYVSWKLVLLFLAVCLSYLLCMQWSLYFMCNAVNVVNVPLVGLVYKRLGIKQDLVDGQVEPIFHVIFRLMYHEMDSQIAYLSGRQRRCEFASLLSSHMQSSFLRYVMSLGFMSVPERRSPILSAYDETISQRSNVIDQRRRSLKSRHQIYATQVCARFIVKNLCFEGFHPDDIVEYFFHRRLRQN
uniref:RGS domain-containing protein n=1 Tax=Macrostomum lignano TaxID=282301 RepID=A0A1I8GAJ2_9PLAT